MGKIFSYLIWSVLLLLWIRDLSYFEILGVCVCFNLLIQAINGIIQEFKLDKRIAFKRISVYDALVFLFVLGSFFIICICKWIGFI